MKTECQCDMPFEIYCDWLRDEGWEIDEEEFSFLSIKSWQLANMKWEHHWYRCLDEFVEVDYILTTTRERSFGSGSSNTCCGTPGYYNSYQHKDFGTAEV